MEERDFIKTKEVFERRVDKLEKGQQYLEMVFLLSAILEREVKATLLRYEDLINTVLTPYKNKGIDFSIKQFTSKEIEKMTLGEMITYLLPVSKNKPLFEKLQEFNTLRKRVIHKLYEIESLPSLEIEIKKYLPKFWQLMSELSELEVLLLKLINGYIKNSLTIIKMKISQKCRKEKSRRIN